MNSTYSCQNIYKFYKAPTKIIVRRLPPNFTLEIFKSQVRPLPVYNYIYFVAADRSYGPNAFCRVYINFLKNEDVLKFKEKFDNYVFIGSRGTGRTVFNNRIAIHVFLLGTEYPAVVEYAQYQKVPKNLIRYKRESDYYGTIFQDRYYHKFLTSLENDCSNHMRRTEFNMKFKNETNKESTTTPLLRYISERKRNKKTSPNIEELPRGTRKKTDGYVVFINSASKRIAKKL